MKRLALAALAAAAFAVAPAVAPAATVPVTITAAGFAPAEVTIDAGDTVTWTNTDAAVHQVASTKKGLFKSPQLSTGQSYSYTFAKAGTYAYRDEKNRSLRGTVTVRAAAEAVTAEAARTVVVYGRATTLSGRISSAGSGEDVSIFARAHGESAFRKIGSATTGGGGAWSFAVVPTIRTVYQAHWKNATSGEVTIRVWPRVTLLIRAGVFRTTVAPALAGKVVWLQRWLEGARRWRYVKHVVLDDSSSARFRWRPAQGSYRVRIIVTQAQSGPGYLVGRSPVRLYVRS